MKAGTEMRTIIRGTHNSVTKRVTAMKKRGWEPLMPKPVYDPGNWHDNIDDSYVMVMENKKLRRTGKTSRPGHQGWGNPKWFL